MGATDGHLKGQHYRAEEPLWMEPTEIMDLDSANILHSWIICVCFSDAQENIRHVHEGEFSHWRTDEGWMRSRASGREHVGLLCCMSAYRSTVCSLSGCGVSQSATLNINESMQIKMSLFQWRQRQGQHVGGQMNRFPPPHALKNLCAAVWLRGYHETHNKDQLDKWSAVKRLHTPLRTQRNTDSIFSLFATRLWLMSVKSVYNESTEMLSSKLLHLHPLQIHFY